MVQPISSHASAPIAILTDFGLQDGYIGVMKAVMAAVAPMRQYIDISHEIAPQDVAAGAWILARSYPYFPAGTVFVCVVDPGVGGERLPLALQAGDWFFVGPDNGLFHYVLEEQPVHLAVALTNARYHLAQVSATFQGRDIFSPVAAHIANGVALADLGSTLAPQSLQRLKNTVIIEQENLINAKVVYIDHFGNVITNIPAHLVPDFYLRSGCQLLFPEQGLIVTERRRFFAERSKNQEEEKMPFIYVDSSGYIGVAVRNDNAAKIIGVERGVEVTLLKGEMK